MQRILEIPEKPITLADLLPKNSLQIAVDRKLRIIKLGTKRNYNEMTVSEIEEYFVYRYETLLFNLEVDREMERLWFTKANEITARSEILTKEDYRTYINV